MLNVLQNLKSQLLLNSLFKLQVKIIFTLIKLKLHKDHVVIHVKYNLPFYEFRGNVIYIHIENTIQMLFQIGKQGNTPFNNLKFRNICQRDSIHSAVQERAERLDRDNVECHLSRKCENHYKNDMYIFI